MKAFTVKRKNIIFFVLTTYCVGDGVLFCLSFLRFLAASIANVLFEPHSAYLKLVLKNWSASGISSWSPGGFASWPAGGFTS